MRSQNDKVLLSASSLGPRATDHKRSMARILITVFGPGGGVGIT